MADPKELVTYIATGLVEDATGIVVEESEDRRQKAVRLTVAPEDMGRVIGRDGRIANAIRTLLKSGRFGERWTLEVRDRE